MTRLLLRIHDYLMAHRPFAAVLLLVMLAAGAALALHLRYEENITDFLPRSRENAKQAAVYDALGDQGQITIVFRPTDESGDEDIMEAIDLFAETFTAVPVQARADESDAMQAIAAVGNRIALYLTPDDYQRIDSLLAQPGYITQSLSAAHQTLSMPLPPMVSDMIVADPLNLFSPAMSRLQALSPSSRYQVTDGYILDNQGNGYAFLSSPYGSSDTRRNKTLADSIYSAVDSINQAMQGRVTASAVGAPLIAVTNATQIKHDSILAIALAVVLIAVILLFSMGRMRNILWLGFSVAAGWLFALAVIAVFKSEISIIVVGIGSVLVGIAVNYPLHYLEHLKEHPDRRETLREMVEPLVTGNVTTVAAFACLVFVKAEAMRDLGLFGSLMLVGTIGFTMVFLPLWAKAGKWKGQVEKLKNEEREKDVENGKPAPAWRQWAFGAIVVVTVVLGYFSTKVEFDSDLHNINYMTAQQRSDLELLGAGVGEGELTYVVSEGETLEDALLANDALGLEGVASLMPSMQRQEEALANWQHLMESHPTLANDLQREAAKAGFADGAFQPFLDRLENSYKPEPCTLDSDIGLLAKNYILPTDTCYYVVNYVHDTADIPQLAASSFQFTQKDVGSGLVNALNDDFNYILYVCSFVVFAFLWLALGRFELAVLAFLPMAMGWLWILGIMALAGIKFNIVNIILATFIFGQGDDYTIFITEGLLYENATGRRRLKEYRRSVIVSALLMFAGIGTLIVAKHPAMRSLAEVAIIGMGSVVMMACVVPPMIFRWLTMRHGSKRQRPVTLGRILITVLPLLVFVLAAVLVVTPLLLLLCLLPLNRLRKRDFFHRFICSLSRMGAKLMPRVKINIENPYGENFDKPAVIVANHSSHLDLLCMLALHPKMIIMTKKWVWHNPLYAHIIRYAEFLPVDGIDEHKPKLRNLVSRGYSIMIFPEGTRTHDGRLGRFHKGAFMLAEELGLELLPVYIHGAYDVWPRHEGFITDGAITVSIGRRCSKDNKEMRAMFESELASMRERLETDEYKQRLERYNYLYKGREVWQTRPRKRIPQLDK